MNKGLKALKKLRQNNIDNTHLFDDELLDTIEKSLKALEIIKNKEINIYIFLHGDIETYDDIVEGNRKLTQKEYELLNYILK